MIASIGSHEESARLDKLTDSYIEVLEAFYGDDWRAGHELVKEQASRIKQYEVSH